MLYLNKGAKMLCNLKKKNELIVSIIYSVSLRQEMVSFGMYRIFHVNTGLF